jgi:hypothetical protein
MQNSRKKNKVVVVRAPLNAVSVGGDFDIVVESAIANSYTSLYTKIHLWLSPPLVLNLVGMLHAILQCFEPKFLNSKLPNSILMSTNLLGHKAEDIISCLKYSGNSV